MNRGVAGTSKAYGRLSMVTRTWAVCGVLSIGLPLGLLQAQQFTIRVNVPLVSLDVAVSDSAGRPVTNLKQSDFLIYEDGQPQDVRNFASADSRYDLVLLFDCSDSTRDQWPLLEEATAGFSRYRKPQDRTLIAAFGDEVQIIRNWNARRDKKLERAVVCNGTHFYEALNWAIQKFNGVKNRRGVVVLTDSADNSIPTRVVEVDGRKVTQFVDSESDRAFQKMLRSVRRSNIPFYFVAVGTDRNPGVEIPAELVNVVMPDLRRMRLRMEQLAEVSGGTVVFPIKAEDVIPMYEQIGRQLGAAYSLGYIPPSPTPDGKRHRIEVRLLKPQNLQLKQSRTEYTAK